MRKSILAITAALLLGASGYALAEPAHPQSSTSGASSSHNPSMSYPTSSFPPSGAPNSSAQMSESQIKQRLEQQGYSNVTLHYAGTAQKNGKQVQVEVDSGGKVTEKYLRQPYISTVPSTIGRDHLIQPVGWKRAVIIVLPSLAGSTS